MCKRFVSYFVIVVAALVTIGCTSQKTKFNPLGEIPVPVDSLFTEANIALGKKMFFDPQLSLNNKVSCATCHKPQFAFADKTPVTLGVRARKGKRNVPSLMNVGYLPHMMAEGMVKTLEMQMLSPLQDETEMSMQLKPLIAKLNQNPYYVKQAEEIYNREVDMFVITRAIAAFQRTLVSNNSAFDQFYYGNNQEAISASAKRGWKLFSEELYCTECHVPPHFTNFSIENNGLYNSFEYSDKGKFTATLDTADIAKFKTPSLRNIMLTKPYMHNGQFFTIEKVLDHYQSGGKNHFNKSKKIQAFSLNDQEQTDIIHFFESLTDTVSWRK